MKTYFSNLIPQLLAYSKKLDSASLLTGQHWKVIDENLNEKTVFIFRPKDNELLISRNGKVEKGSWDLIDHNTLLIDTKTESRMFKHGFADDVVLALRVDGKTEYAFLVDENKIPESVNTIEQVGRYLEMKYISKRNEILEADKAQVIRDDEEKKKKKKEPGIGFAITILLVSLAGIALFFFLSKWFLSTMS